MDGASSPLTLSSGGGEGVESHDGEGMGAAGETPALLSNWASSSGTANQSSRAQSRGHCQFTLIQGIRRWMESCRRGRFSGEAACSRVKRAVRNRSGRSAGVARMAATGAKSVERSGLMVESGTRGAVDSSSLNPAKNMARRTCPIWRRIAGWVNWESMMRVLSLKFGV